MKKVAFCSECGTRYPNAEWPRICSQCPNREWNSPKPVVVVLQPVSAREPFGKSDIGLAIGRRAILPEIGKWALISGFSDPDDASLEDSARREFMEETGLDVSAEPRLVYSRNSHNNNMLSFCVIDKPMPMDVWMNSKCCPENSELTVLWDNSKYDIAFPLHEEAIEKWFKGEMR